MRHRIRGAALACVIGAGLAAGCGFDVQSADLFLITRTGQGSKLTEEVNNSGTIRCNGGQPRMISSARLISARDLSDNLITDAGKNLKLPIPSGTSYVFKISMQQGTITFPDRSVAGHPELASALLFATQVAQQVCRQGAG